MKTTWLILGVLVGLAISTPAQTDTDLKLRTVTFTNLQGRVFENVRLSRANKDGVVYLTDDGGGMVLYTNLSPDLLAMWNLKTNLGQLYLDRIEARLQAKKRAAEEAKAFGEAKADPIHSIQKYKDTFGLYKFDESDFPKMAGARQACKEIVAELNGISKALEIGVSYNKFSDLLTDKALAVEKIKDLRGEGIPSAFLLHADSCVNAFKESKNCWNKKIQDEHPEIKILDEYFMRDYWAIANLRLICCSGIADSNTNAITLVIDKMAEIIKSQQDAVKDGILDAKDGFDPHISGLTVEQIAARLKAALSATNAPATN
jgi:hypothetical protein